MTSNKLKRQDTLELVLNLEIHTSPSVPTSRLHRPAMVAVADIIHDPLILGMPLVLDYWHHIYRGMLTCCSLDLQEA